MEATLLLVLLAVAMEPLLLLHHQVLVAALAGQEDRIQGCLAVAHIKAALVVVVVVESRGQTYHMRAVLAVPSQEHQAAAALVALVLQPHQVSEEMEQKGLLQGLEAAAAVVVDQPLELAALVRMVVLAALAAAVVAHQFQAQTLALVALAALALPEFTLGKESKNESTRYSKRFCGQHN
jgi:hypothetical protein